jgi:RHS repeat-associated protein
MISLLVPYSLVYAFESGENPQQQSTAVTDSASGIALDQAIESGQVTTLGPLGTGTVNSVASPLPTTGQSAQQNQNQTTSQSLSVPSVGITSDVDESSGAFMYSYPITVPVGKGGLTPQLSLEYDSRKNNFGSYIGLGWDIAIPKIERLNKNGTDVLFDETNFASSVDGELSRTSTTTGQFGNYTVKFGVGEYQFLDNNSWKVTDKNGITYIYGAQRNSRIDSGDMDETTSWYLSSMTDLLGNTVTYNYVSSEGKLYPQSILYSNGMHRVDFTYQLYSTTSTTGQSLDTIVDYGTGVRSKADRKLVNISTYTLSNKVLNYDLVSGDFLTSIQNAQQGNISFTYNTLAPIATSHNTVGTENTHMEFFRLPVDRSGFYFTASNISNPSPSSPYYHNFAQNPNGTWIDLDEDGYKEMIMTFTDFRVRPAMTTSNWQTFNPNNAPVTNRKVTMEVYEFNPTENEDMVERVDMRILGRQSNMFEFNGPTTINKNPGDYFVNSIDTNIRYINDVPVLLFNFIHHTNSNDQFSINMAWSELYSMWIEQQGPTTQTPSTFSTNFSVLDPVPLTPAIVNQIATTTLPVKEWLDIDNDGDQDYLVSHSTGVMLFRNNGTTLVYDPLFAIAGYNLSDTTNQASGEPRVIWRDINGDGRIDLLRTHYWFLNRGNYLQFSEGYTFANNDQIQNITARSFYDINSDGLLDVPALRMINNGNGFTIVSNDTINSWGIKTLGYTVESQIVSTTNFTHNYSTMRAKAYRLAPHLPWNSMSDYLAMDFNGDRYVDYSFRFSNGRRVVIWGNATNTNDFEDVYPYGKLKTIYGGDITSPAQTQINYAVAPVQNEYVDGVRDTVYVVSSLDFGTTQTGPITSGGSNSMNVPVTKKFTYTNGYVYKDQSEISRRLPVFHTVTETDSAGFSTTSYFHQGNGNDINTSEIGDTDRSKVGKKYLVETKNLQGDYLSLDAIEWKTHYFSPQKQFTFPKRSFSFDTVKNIATAKGYTYDVVIGELVRTDDYGAITNPGYSLQGLRWTDVGNDTITTEIGYTATLPLVRPRYVRTIDPTSQKVLQETTYQWDGGVLSRGLLTQKSERVSATEQAVTTYRYNQAGLLTKVTDPVGADTMYSYDNYGQYPQSVTNALGQTTNFQYDYSVGKPKKITEPDGVYHEYTYDPLYGIDTEFKTNGTMRRSQSINNQQRVFYQYVYRSPEYQTANYIQQNRRNGSVLQNYTWYYNQQGLLSLYNSPVGSDSYMYNGRGQVSYYVPVGSYSYNGITTTYDQYGRESLVQTPVNQYTVNYQGRSQTQTYSNGDFNRVTTNARGAVISVENNYGTTHYTYNKRNNLTKIVDADGLTRNFAYDMIGRKISQNDYHITGDDSVIQWQFGYDNNNNLLSELRNGQVVHTYQYDPIGRLTTTNKGQDIISQSYDTCRVGRLCAVSRNNGVSSAFTYDTKGRVATETKTIGQNSKQFSYYYNNDGSLYAIRTPIGEIEMGNNVQGVNDIFWNSTQVMQNGQYSYYPDVDIDYTGGGKFSRVWFMNRAYAQPSLSLIQNYTYDITKLNRLATSTFQSTPSGQGTNTLIQQQFNYDTTGRLSHVQDTGTINPRTMTYTYDALDRLTRYQVTGQTQGQAVDMNYGYSPAGTLIQKTGSTIINHNNQGQGIVLPTPVIQQVQSPTPGVIDTNNSEESSQLNNPHILSRAGRVMRAVLGIQTAYADEIPQGSTVEIERYRQEIRELNELVSEIKQREGVLDLETRLLLDQYEERIRYLTNLLPKETEDTTPKTITQNPITYVNNTTIMGSAMECTSGMVTINKGRTQVTKQFAAALSDDPIVLITPINAMGQTFQLGAVSTQGFTLSISQKDYLSKKSFYYLACVSDDDDGQSDPDDIYTEPTVVYHDILADVTLPNVPPTVPPGVVNAYVNPHAIIRMDNIYYVCNDIGQIVGQYEYDAQGSVIQSQNYTYTGDDRVHSIDNQSVTITNLYDAQGVKVQETTLNKVTNQTETVIYWMDNYREYSDREEFDVLLPNGARAMTIVHNKQTGLQTKKYYVNDVVGSTSIVLSENGTIIEQTDANPYGDVRFENNNSQTSTYFALHERNDNVDVIDMNARYYNPYTTQFTSLDPASIYTPESFLLDPQQLHTYAYARNNPVKYNDPTGAYSEEFPYITYNDVQDATVSTYELFRDSALAILDFTDIGDAKVIATGTGFTGESQNRTVSAIGIGVPLIGGRLISTFGDTANNLRRVDNLSYLREIARANNWGDYRSLSEHATRHAADFKLKPSDVRGYAKSANNWIRDAREGVKSGAREWKSYVAVDGKTRYFNSDTGMFGVQNTNGTIASVYKPGRGVNYYNDLKKGKIKPKYKEKK